MFDLGHDNITTLCCCLVTSSVSRCWRILVFIVLSLAMSKRTLAHQLEFYVCRFYEVKLTTSCSVAANLVLQCQMTSAGACPQTLWAYNCSNFVHSLSVLEGAMCLLPIRYNYVLNKGTSDVTTYETKLFALTQSYYFLFQGHYNQNHQHCPNMQFFFHAFSSLNTFTFFLANRSL